MSRAYISSFSRRRQREPIDTKKCSLGAVFTILGAHERSKLYHARARRDIFIYRHGFKQRRGFKAGVSDDEQVKKARFIFYLRHDKMLYMKYDIDVIVEFVKIE